MLRSAAAAPPDDIENGIASWPRNAIDFWYSGALCDTKCEPPSPSASERSTPSTIAVSSRRGGLRVNPPTIHELVACSAFIACAPFALVGGAVTPIFSARVPCEGEVGLQALDAAPPAPAVTTAGTAARRSLMARLNCSVCASSRMRKCAVLRNRRKLQNTNNLW